MQTQTTVQPQPQAALTGPRPMNAIGALASLAYFLIPAGLVFLSFHVFRPWLEQQGYPELTSYLASMCVPLAGLFAAALIGYARVENRPLTIADFSARMRYPRLRWRDALIGLAIFLLGSLGYGLLTPLTRVAIQAGWIPLPAHLPALADPTVLLSGDVLNRSAGGQIHGQWQVVILFLVTYFFNIAGEELWWRGYIFPRQQMAFGRYTWLVHGLSWALFHAFKWWDIFGLLPICLLIAYSAQRLKTNWPALIAHALANLGGPLLILLAVIH